MPRYIIVAGINGAGKSTLYDTFPELFTGTNRINADEILRRSGEDWRNRRSMIKAMRTAVSLIKTNIQNGTDFHTETTLSGTGHAQLSYLSLAHKYGFSITLLYITLASPKIAVDRVHQRVKKGGHGVPDELIVKRYQQSLNNLAKLASSIDEIQIFENSHGLNLIYARNRHQLLLNKLSIAPWLPDSDSLKYDP